MTEPEPTQGVLVQESIDILLLVMTIGVAAAVTVGFVTWLLLRAADKPAGAMVTLSLALLTLLALGLYGATREEALVGVVGSGIGALAGAVTYQLGGGREVSTDDRSDEVPKGPPAGEGPDPEG